MSRMTGNAQSRATFFRHSAVLSLTAALLRKLPIIHSQRQIKEISDPEKLTFFTNSEHKSTKRSTGSSSLPYSLPSL